MQQFKDWFHSMTFSLRFPFTLVLDDNERLNYVFITRENSVVFVQSMYFNTLFFARHSLHLKLKYLDRLDLLTATQWHRER